MTTQPITTRNGFPIDPKLDAVVVNGHTARVRAGDVATCLQWLVTAWHARVEPVETLSGYRSRAGNAATGTYGDADASNHRSGTALDLNGFRYPYEYTHKKTWRTGFTGDKLARARTVLATYPGLFRWGRDFQPGWRDEMHVEIAPGADVARFAALIRSQTSTTPPTHTTEDNTMWIAKPIDVDEAWYIIEAGRATVIAARQVTADQKRVAIATDPDTLKRVLKGRTIA